MTRIAGFRLYPSQVSKYRNRKLSVDGDEFDSQKEAIRYQELKILEKIGEIEGLRRQVKYLLIPEQREQDKTGKRGGVQKGKILEREVSYIADFVYTKDGETIVEDTKGVRTKEYIIKRKLMLFIHGIRIHEI
jgi:hypothetical protein